MNNDNNQDLPNPTPMPEHEVDYYAIQAINNFTNFTKHLSREEQQIAIQQLIRVSELFIRCLNHDADSNPDKPMSVDVVLAFRDVKEIYEKNFAIGEFQSDGVH